MNKYVKQYKWASIFKMIKNQKKEPLVCDENFNDRLVVVTGATSGIGYEAVKKFASKGANILTINRNEEKSIQLCEEIESKFAVKCNYLIADFSKLNDVHRVGNTLSTLENNIDVLIHNAGTYVTEKQYTNDGFELVFQTNYLSTFVLNYILKDKFVSQNSGRIIFVNSEAHRFAAWGLHMDDLNWRHHKYKGIKGYGFAKLAQLLSMLKFHQMYKNTNVTINAMHPGNVVTNSGSSNGKIYKFFKRNVIDKGARPINVASEALYYLSVSQEVSDISGKFFSLTTMEEPAPPALDIEEADKLWELSMEYGGLHE